MGPYSISVGRELVAVDSCLDALQVGWCTVVATAGSGMAAAAASSLEASRSSVVGAPSVGRIGCQESPQVTGFDRIVGSHREMEVDTYLADSRQGGDLVEDDPS